MTAVSTDLSTLSREELATLAASHASQAQAAQAEIARLNDQEQREREAARDAWALNLINSHHEIDSQLDRQGREQEQLFHQAIAAGDLNAAIRAFIAKSATREARRHLRSEVGGAEGRLHTGKRIMSELGLTNPVFTDDLQAALHVAIANAGADLYESLVGDESS